MLQLLFQHRPCTLFEQSYVHNRRNASSVCITNNQQNTNSNPNHNPNHITEEHAIVVTSHIHPTQSEKFVRDNIVAPLLLLFVVIVSQSLCSFAAT